jgi:23S rRNA (pseudouridine1915-N3)-methyltransferase
MKIKLITVGSPQLSFAREGIIEYQKRITRFANIEILHLKKNKYTDTKIKDALGNYFCILLDEKGIEFSTQELAHFIEQKKNNSQNIAIIIGGPNGHSDEIKALGCYSLSLSRLTFPHDIAMMVVLETFYRSLTLLFGHPYHRE